jgi:hypothetical protein
VKWSMVEPAIAITAMNIATLRPMFKNVLHFASKRVDGSFDDESTLRPSGESQMRLRSGNNVSAKEYSAEFAEMLGLSRVGVTTTISGGGSDTEKAHLRRRFTLRKPSVVKEEVQNESQTELHYVPSLPDNVDWNSVIKTTTVITIARDT